MWKIRKILYMLNAAYSKFHNPSEHLAIYKVIVLFKRRVVFKQYIPKKRKRFGIKILRLCGATLCTYGWKCNWGKTENVPLQTRQ
jgi:hypothetical protein